MKLYKIYLTRQGCSQTVQTANLVLPFHLEIGYHIGDSSWFFKVRYMDIFGVLNGHIAKFEMGLKSFAAAKTAAEDFINQHPEIRVAANGTIFSIQPQVLAYTYPKDQNGPLPEYATHASNDKIFTPIQVDGRNIVEVLTGKILATFDNDEALSISSDIPLQTKSSWLHACDRRKGLTHCRERVAWLLIDQFPENYIPVLVDSMQYAGLIEKPIIPEFPRIWGRPSHNQK